MSAEFKSHILLRDEKGFMGITFKRLLLAGTVGGLTYTLARIALPDVALIFSIFLTISMIVMTGRQGGIPLWMRLMYRVRGALMLMAIKQPSGIVAEVVHMMNLPVEIVQLDSDQLFAQRSSSTILDFHDWVTYSRPVDVDHNDGLQLFATAEASEAHD